MVFVWMRRVYQAVFLALFLFLVLATSASLIGGYPVEWFLGLDPLIAVSTALAGGTLHAPLAWSIGLLVLTLIFGRFFCGWICPMGTLHHFFSWVGKLRKVKDRIQLNRPRPIYKLKYYLLIGMLGTAVVGSTQVGLLDPIAFTWRAFATVFVPAADSVALGIYQGDRHFHFSTLIAALFITAMALNVFIPRLYCRVLCPLGALLGLLARFSLFRIERDAERCNDCGLCASDCQGAADPQNKVNVAECMLCLNCQLSCKQDAVFYRFLPSPDLATDELDLGRRRVITAAVAGLVAVPLARASDGFGPRPHPMRIRPPGSFDEEAFLERCIKCGACMKICPTGGLQPALHEAGLEGLWTPLLVPRIGYCEQICVLCSRVCPTAAIRPITIQEKIGKPPDNEPIRIGTAFFDRGRCLPWAMDTPCIVCEEVCPTSPKAIHYTTVTVTTRDGRTVNLKRPQIDPAYCTGCGTCETRCPVFDKAAVRVTSVGETRSATNRIMLTDEV